MRMVEMLAAEGHFHMLSASRQFGCLARTTATAEIRNSESARTSQTARPPILDQSFASANRCRTAERPYESYDPLLTDVTEPQIERTDSNPKDTATFWQVQLGLADRDQ
jgi:hypothetical protein